jgi:hypothetical protein
MNPQQPTTQMDPQAIALAQAIRKTESNDNFNAKGKSGESGAYQWMPTTWQAHAKEVLGDPNAPMTPSNQNAVAYTIIKGWKDKGLNPAQIAAKWNSGSHVGWENKVGTNSQGVSYNVPAYVKSVTDTYQQIKGGNTDATQIPNSSTAQSTPVDTQTSGFLGTNPNDTLYGKVLDNSITRGIKDFFPGEKVGQAIGTLGGYVASGFDPNYDLSAPTPLQVAGDVAQGALMVGTGQPESSTGLSVFGKTIPTLQTASTGLGRIAQGIGIGAGYGATGAIAGGSTNIKDIATQGVIGGAVGGVAGGVAEGVNSVLNNLPSRLTKTVLPQLQNEDTINYAIKNVKLGTTENMVNESQKALTSYNKQIDGILSHPQYANDSIIASDILTGVKTAFPRSEYDIPTIISKIKTQVPSEAATLTKIGKGGELSLEEANTLRQAIDKATYKTTSFDSPEVKAGKELAQAVGNSIRETVKKIAPETVPIFDGFSKEIRLFKALSSLEKRTGKKSLIGMKDLWSLMAGGATGGLPGAMVGLGLEKVSSNPAVKLVTAKVVQKVAPAISGATKVGAKVAPLIPGTLSRQ